MLYSGFNQRPEVVNAASVVFSSIQIVNTYCIFMGCVCVWIASIGAVGLSLIAKEGTGEQGPTITCVGIDKR